eukprot:1140118-Pelagomonas_calceolata.AAC.6
MHLFNLVVLSSDAPRGFMGRIVLGQWLEECLRTWSVVDEGGCLKRAVPRVWVSHTCLITWSMPRQGAAQPIRACRASRARLTKQNMPGHVEDA